MGLRAIMTAVDYHDLLAVTLPYNRHHFDEVWIVTDMRSTGDEKFQRAITSVKSCCVVYTDLFYADGAIFNKWRALEWGLDQMGRHGWICLMDADVLWPKDMKWKESHWDRSHLEMWTTKGALSTHTFTINQGQLCTPLRRMAPWPPKAPYYHANDDWRDYPQECDWGKFPIHRNVQEWAGYSQIFHASDPVLGPPPWHQIDWRHAGGGDSFLQAKWPKHKKVRPPFHCLHLGEAGCNWMGRAAPFLDGTRPEGSDEKRRAMQELWAGRRRAGPGRFEHEKLR
jgi:hypothetical protein